MATTIATPAASAPAAAPAPVAAPAAPAAPTVVQPVAPANAQPAEPQSLEQRLSEGWKAAKEAVPSDGTATEQPTDEAGAAGAGEGEAAEAAVAAEQPDAAAADVAAEAPDAAAQAAAAAEPVEFDDGELLAPKAFADELAKDPAAQKFFADRPELKGKVFAALRRDGENREIRQWIPDVETAKAAVQGASTFQVLDTHFLDATTPDGVSGFLKHWAEMAVETDAEGRPVMENGEYKFHPAFPMILKTIFDNSLASMRHNAQQSGKLDGPLAEVMSDGLRVLEAQAQKSGDERLQMAVDILRGVIPPPPPAQEELPEHMKQAAADIKRREQELNRQQLEQQSALHEQSIERSEAGASESIKAQLKPLFARSGLSETLQKKALGDIGDRIDARLAQHPFYQVTYDSIAARPAGEDREKALTAHILKYATPHVGPIAAEVLREYSAPAAAAGADKANRVAAQAHASRTEPRGASISSVQQAPKTSNAAIIAEYKAAHNGEEPAMEWVLGEAMKRARSGVAAR